MLEPGIGIGREIGVVAEDILCALVFFQLHQEALLADVDVERIVDLPAVEIRSSTDKSRKAETFPGRRRFGCIPRRRNGTVSWQLSVSEFQEKASS